MAQQLAQLADVDGWLRWLVIAIAGLPIVLLVLVVVGGLLGWVRNPSKMWTKQK